MDFLEVKMNLVKVHLVTEASHESGSTLSHVKSETQRPINEARYFQAENREPN